MQLILRNVDFDLVSLLRKRASKNGRTPEEEHLAILEQALRVDRATKYTSMLAAAQKFGAGLAGHTPPPKPDDSEG